MGIIATATRWTRKVFIETTVFLWILLAMAGVAIAWGWLEMEKMRNAIQL
jgi:hypothetical protein